MIQSNTCSDVFELGGEVPETMVSGETSDISPFCQHAWYEWIKFRDTGPNFPDDKELLGCYLGPSIDVGPAMTAKILKANGQVLHRSTYRALNQAEWASEEERKAQQAFDQTMEAKLGIKMNWEDLPAEDAETPTYPLYEDDSGENHEHVPDEEVTPEVGDAYTNARVTLQQHGQSVTARVIGRK